jgi:hypothetical protein
MTENAFAARRDYLVGQNFPDNPLELLKPFDGRKEVTA